MPFFFIISCMGFMIKSPASAKPPPKITISGEIIVIALRIAIPK